MRRLLSFLLVALAFVGPAAAAERTLITPLAPQATLSTTPAAAAELGTLSQAATAKGHIKVIVGLRVPFAPEASLAGSERLAQRRDIAAAAGLLRSRFAAAVTNRPAAVRSYSTLPFVALDVTPDELRKLAADPLVISISENIKLRGRLAESAPLIRAPQAWAAGFTGAGQTIAIIDSGIDKTHPFLAGKVVSEACYSQGGYCAGATSSTAVGSGVPCPRPYPCAHGTHVAGIAAGVGPSASGIAKGANLISIQVFSPDPDDPENIFAWYSLGGSRAKRSCDSAYPAMTAAIANLQSAGIATVIASGNEGWKDAIAFPACISKAVSVGAVSDGDVGICGDGQPMTVDKVACYSNGASFVSLLAPGSLITSSVPGGGYESWDGTSMATPHVAGA
jgi:subtilisin family serine protease